MLMALILKCNNLTLKSNWRIYATIIKHFNLNVVFYIYNTYTEFFFFLNISLDLHCWTCHAASYEECLSAGHLSKCQSNEVSDGVQI